MKITVLYGTETGNAEMLAEDIASELQSEHTVECCNLCDFPPDAFKSDHLYLIVCSTYGDGELPASAQPFAEALETTAPDLSGIHFAVFGLGDSEYEETFNFGGKRMAELLAARGATQVGERAKHDASGSDMPEDIALPWAEEVIALAAEKMQETA
ncbi:flavodoxin domain-containing protein [Chelativorans intermedius]|uniref:Flavodoxin domain-containing protein n=1 Tax=Chelativorans intermedius TaxID=515947 RepID=A0ABV6D4E1_9HYPH|nr:flavodoxin domain-containing protein [Chelativorans intermedius]MCT8997585.1 flavodoxin domain-containing protein [Chelativorans intermedius]